LFPSLTTKKMVTFTDFWPRLKVTSFWIFVSLACFHSGPYIALVYWGGIHLVALYEMQTLLSVSLLSMIINMLTSCLIFLGLSASHFGFPQVNVEVMLPLAFIPFVCALIDSRGNFWSTCVTGISFIWITIPCYLCYRLNLLNVNFMMAFLTVTWITDFGCYMAGHMFGRTPLLERISPKKTIEGSIGGAIVTFVVAHIISHYNSYVGWTDWMVIAFIAVVFGQLGDLFESMFKRALQVKDSGSLIGRSGGLMDRFDSVFFSVVFVNAYLAL